MGGKSRCQGYHGSDPVGRGVGAGLPPAADTQARYSNDEATGRMLNTTSVSGACMQDYLTNYITPPIPVAGPTPSPPVRRTGLSAATWS